MTTVIINEQITESICPHCKADVTSIKRFNKHTNGHWNEEKSFECGLTITFSPNFMKKYETSKCQWSPGAQALRKRRLKAMDELRTHIGTMKIDDEYKLEILNALSNLGRR